jgi:hypothetical protein
LALLLLSKIVSNIKSKNMKTPALKLFFFLLIISFNQMSAQDVTTIEAANTDISDNMDLEAVASVFGDAKDLEDFEKKLNDPDLKISNLDLNNDGEVDYIRVVETAKGNTHSIALEAVIGKDQFQEIAVIDVVKDKSNKTQVQVVGNVDMYGPNYYIEPVYPVIPVFFTFFWMATYRPWYSPWYWGYHPHYWHPWRPFPPYIYRNHVHAHINVNINYHRSNVRINNNYNRRSSNNDYFKRNPDKSFNKRNPGVSNRADLEKRKRNTSDRSTRPAKKDYKSTGRPVTKPATRPSTKPSTRPSTKPTTRPSTKPSTRPSTKPATRPSTKPSTRPTTRPSTRPTTRPSTRPATRPSTRPSARTYSRASAPRGSFRRR